MDLNDNEEHSFQELCETIAHLENAQHVASFLRDLCTPQELAALTDRWHICRLLEQGDLSYREIQQVTGASLVTIGRVARCLKYEKVHGYKNALDTLKKKIKL